MRSHRWLVLLLLFAVVLAPLPALAQANNVLLIDGGDLEEPKELPKLLNDEEVAKIERLQGAVRWAALSPVSPDDTRLLVANSNGEFGVLNIVDGTSQAIPFEQFGPIVPLSLLSPFQEGFQWVDPSVVASLAVNLAAQSADEAFGVVYLNVDTGEVAGAPLPIGENGVPVSLSPGAHSAIALEVEQPPQEGGMVRIPSRFQAEDGRAAVTAPAATVAAALAKAPQLRPFMPIAQGANSYRAMQVAETRLRLQVIDVASGSARELAAFPEGVTPGYLSWRPDGAELALSILGVFDPDQTRNLGRQVLDGALISEEIYRDVTGNLPPEINPMLQGGELRIFDLAGGESRGVRVKDSGGDLFLAPSWAQDNSTLMVRMLPPGKPAGRTYPSYSGAQADRSYYRFYNRDLQELGRFTAPQISAPFTGGAVFASPDEVIFLGPSGTNVHPYYYNRVSGEFRNLADRAGTYELVLPTRASRQLVYVHSSFTTPPDLYRMGWDGSAVTRLTWSNEELRLESQTREYPVSFTLRNGKRWPGTLILPADVSFPPKNVPIVVWQEGGPGGTMNGQWAANVENPYALLPNFGFGLLVVPLSGREGNGPTALRELSDRANFGQIDIDEQAEIARQLISRGWTSSAKLGITGCSYGGYFAWQSVMRHPDLYRAANPQCALIDLPTEWTRGYAASLPALQGLPPWAAPTEYIRDSPSYNAARVKAAVLSFHGTDDFLPVTLNENLHLQVFNNKVPARMVKFAGAGHGLARDDYQLYAAQEQISWFREQLR